MFTRSDRRHSCSLHDINSRARIYPFPLPPETCKRWAKRTLGTNTILARGAIGENVSSKFSEEINKNRVSEWVSECLMAWLRHPWVKKELGSEKMFVYFQTLLFSPWSQWRPYGDVVERYEKQTSVYPTKMLMFKRTLCIRFLHFQYWHSDAIEVTTGAA